jgi:hypothetical protein
MFTDIHIEADRRMADYGRDAERALMAAGAQEPETGIEARRPGVRFHVPEWLRRAPSALRSSTR